MSEVKDKRRASITDEDIKKYEPMIDLYLRESVVKNWNEASMAKSEGDVALGNSGWTMNDIRQHLRTEVFVALVNYNPDFTGASGVKAKESTFVFNHLRFRVGQLMKKLAKRPMGYGIWSSNLEEVLYEIDKYQG